MKRRTAILVTFCITAGTIGITGLQAGAVAESAQTEAEEAMAEFAETEMASAEAEETELPAGDAEIKTAKNASAIQTIWLGAIKTDVSAFGKDRANKLQSQIAALIEAGAAENAPAQEETQPTFSICIRYENGDRELYTFYRANEAWYMKTADETIYPNAKFCTDYVSFSDGGEESGFQVEISDSMQLPDVDLEAKYSEHGKDWYLATEPEKRMAYGQSKEEAEASVRQDIENGEKLYAYASRKYTCTDEEVEEAIEEYLSALKTADGYDALEESFAAAGLNLEEYEHKSAPIFRYRIMQEHVYQEAYDAFRSGEDEIDGVVYDTLEEYWRAFLEKEVYGAET